LASVRGYAGEVGTGELAGSDTNNAPLQIQMDMTVAPAIEGVLYSNLTTRGQVGLFNAITATATGTISSGSVDYRVRDNGDNSAYYGIEYSTAVRSSGMTQTNITQSADTISAQAETYDAKQGDVTSYAYTSSGTVAVASTSGLTAVQTQTQQLTVSSNNTHCGFDYAQVNQNFCYSGSNTNADMDRALFGKIKSSDTAGTTKSTGLVITWASSN
ncbi:MAG: hypothetical protein JNK65_01360, partial [Deltaproteobacteria bacterium]|nr:hypothetical protein [Deltaproteobacteria bacterium]